MHDLPPSAMNDEHIREALIAGDVDQVEEAYDVLWYELPSRFASEILDATKALDPSVFLRRPRLMHLTLLAHHQQDYLGENPDLGKILQMFSIQGRRYANILPEFTNPSDLLTAGTIALIAARLDGAYRRADQLGTWLDEQLSALGTRNLLPWSTQHVRAKPGWLSTQRGLTATLGGDLDYAVRLYTRGFSEAGSAPRGHFAGANSAANLALVAASRGHLDIARSWIEKMESIGPLPLWIEHLTALGAKIAAALVAAAEGDAELSRQHLDRAGPATQNVELWPFIVHARAIYHATYGDPYEGLRELEAARLTHGALSPIDQGVTRELLLRAEALLLLRTHNAGRVLNLARREPDHFPPQFTAWAHLYAGDTHRAIRAAARALQRPTARPPLNDAIELHLAMAVGHMRNGDAERAAASFRAALGLRSTPAQIRPFLSAAREDISALAELAGVPDPLTSTPRHFVTPASPHAETFVNLTRRESAVLHALDRGETAVAAARRFGVSPATVRSQVRSVYRKLGVSGREAALARAHELGLLSMKQ